MGKVLREGTQLNLLAEMLFNDLQVEMKKSPQAFFAGLQVVVPNKKMESWLKAYWLKNKNNVLMNVEFINIDSFLFCIFENTKNLSLASIADFKYGIIKLLSTKKYDDYYKDDKRDWSKVRNYLFDDVDGEMVLNATKLYELATTLSDLFSNYEKENVIITDWQLDLYNELIDDLMNNNVPLTTIKQSENKEMINCDKPVFVFGFLTLPPLYFSILDKYSRKNPLYYYEINFENVEKEIATGGVKYEISSSPFITKEIEIVHSKICELLLSDPNIKASDILVLGNNISDYENAIKKVFVQEEKTDHPFPSIPFSISGAKSEDSNVTLVLNILLDISEKGFFTRLDFNSLITNPLIRKVKNITDEQIEQWMNSIYSLKIFRGSIGLYDDWEYIRKRILLSKFSNVNFEDNKVLVQGKDFIPYSSIGLDDDSIVSLVSIIDNIKSWTEMINAENITNTNCLERLELEMKKWFADECATNQDKRFKKALDLVNYWKQNNIAAPIKTLFLSILDATRIKSISFKEPFVTGVTFMEFNENITYYHKYVFFINAGSNSLPKKIVKSELDLRNDVDKSKERKSFRTQYRNCEHFYISFIGQDLKKDAELFESSLSKEIREELDPIPVGMTNDDYEDYLKNKITKHTIDETRDWNELFTRGEYNRKEYREGLSGFSVTKQISNQQPIDPEKEKQERRKKISTSDIANYLAEPLSFKANYLFGKEDDTSEQNHDEYEPFTLNRLEESIIVSKICELQINSIKAGNTSTCNYEDYKQMLELENKLPHVDENEEIKEEAFKNAVQVAKDVIEYIGISNDPSAFEIITLPDLLMNNNGEEWVLTSSKKILRYKNGDNISYYEFKKTAKEVRKAFPLYACSLMDVALINDTKTYNITIHNGKEPLFSLTSSEAKEILNKIFEAINNYNDNYFSFFEHKDKDVESFSKLLKFICDGDNGKWPSLFFPYIKLFDMENEIGYDKENYKPADYEANVDKIIELAKCLGSADNNGGANNGGI